MESQGSAVNSSIAITDDVSMMIVDPIFQEKNTSHRNIIIAKTVARLNLERVRTKARLSIFGEKTKKFRYGDSNPGILRERQVC